MFFLILSGRNPSYAKLVNIFDYNVVERDKITRVLYKTTDKLIFAEWATGISDFAYCVENQHCRTKKSVPPRCKIFAASLKTINKTNIRTNNDYIYINISFILTNISFIYTFLRSGGKFALQCQYFLSGMKATLPRGDIKNPPRRRGRTNEKIIVYQITPKYFSKNTFNFSITVFFFSCLLPPPKRDIAGSILSMSVPVVRIAPSRKAFSTNLAVSSAFSFSLAIISFRSSCLHCFSYASH